ncbi:TRIC cation channel family protein [Streptomyces sp. NPDC091204]|uniref:TRIC cation channel family protein n=1 Tax=Streptomyces sp. NPDC091204 TaxID=3155299 RepID=UPI0034148FD7
MRGTVPSAEAGPGRTADAAPAPGATPSTGRRGHPVAVLILAVLTGVTGVTGEVVRDVLCGEFPPLLLREEVYATAALAGAAAYLGLHRAGVPATVGTAVRAGLVFTLRMAAVFRDLHLPRLRHVPG